MNGQNRRWFDIAMLAVAGCATVAVAVGLEGPLRSVVVFAALILVPGAAVVPYLQIRDLSQFLGLTIAFSLGVGVIGAMILASLGWWHPWHDDRTELRSNLRVCSVSAGRIGSPATGWRGAW
jgi:hypothetical protein